MKNLLIIIVAILFITSCNGNSMGKDATKLAKENFKVLKDLEKKYEAGEVSSEIDEDEYYAKNYPKVYALNQKMKEKYKDRFDEFEELHDKELKALMSVNLINDNETSQENDLSNEDSDNNKKETASNELMSMTKNILKSNDFIFENGLTSIVYLTFEDEIFTIYVTAMNSSLKVEVISKIKGTYKIKPAIDGSIAKVQLFIDGEIQKSYINPDQGGISTEVFFYRNNELMLKHSSGSKDNTPKYLLVGTNSFYSQKILTKAEKDSIANIEKQEQNLLNAVDDL